MRWFLFFARAAFICNLFFILCLFLRYTGITLPESISGFVIIVGWILSIIVNAGTHLLLVGLVFKKQRPERLVWVHIFNALCLILQVVYFLF